jgi:DNA processing protein
MAVPGSPLDPRHRGTNQLLRDGATLIESADDVRAAVAPYLTVPKTVRSRRQTAPPVAPEPPPAHDATSTDVLSRIRERLGPEPLLVDELIRQCHATSSEVHHALLELELDGRIERHPGNRVSLASA